MNSVMDSITVLDNVEIKDLIYIVRGQQVMEEEYDFLTLLQNWELKKWYDNKKEVIQSWRNKKSLNLKMESYYWKFLLHQNQTMFG